MPYKHHIENCFEEVIGKKAGISRNAFEKNLEIAQTQIAKLRIQKDSGELPLLNLPAQTNDLDQIKQIADQIKNSFKELIVFGIGGSSLGGQTLCGVKFYQHAFEDNKTRIKFFDNIHYHNFNLLLDAINIKETAFLVISKSGGTIETISQTLVTIDHFKEKVDNLGKHFFFITEDSDNPLRNIGKNMGATILDHNPKIGGRYSCFTNVGLIPAYISGVDIDAVRSGANQVTNDLFNNDISNVAEGAALILTIMQKGYPNNVIIPYLQRLSYLTYWYVQLFAESIGKDGKGMTPIKALGSVDQHSQLQLFLDGPKDKFFTFLTLNTENLGTKLQDSFNGFQHIEYLKGKTLGDVMNAQQEATIQTLTEHQCPVRRFHFTEFNDKSLGAILMHFMLETILIGYALDIDPFDQPAVESGKIIAKKMLCK